MRIWTTARTRAIAWRRPATCARLKAPFRFFQFQRFSTTVSETQSAPQERLPSYRKYAIWSKIERPTNDVKEWAALLDGGLPPHLRDWDSTASPPNLSTVEVAEILLEAQRSRDTNTESHDLLFYLGFEQGRWSAVVWLIKRLVEKFPVRHGQPSRLSRVNTLWEQVPSLDDFCRHPYELDFKESLPPSGVLEARSLFELTDGRSPENVSREEQVAHDALGQIWRTLGAMTKACAVEGDIRPEVLEIIAYLHHKEIMPMSIYQGEPPIDRSAIHQPPLLSMLSSRILTSLSDAAWRAHEKIVIEEAKAGGGEYAALRPEIPGTVYRVHVAGLRPEVWMELILWSCLHGGWITQGSDILRSIASDLSNPWRPFSWREHEDMVASNGKSGNNQWQDLEYIYKTRAASAMDEPSSPTQQVDRTVSAEVVSAYIDALVTIVNVGVGGRGVQIEAVLDHLNALHVFVQKLGVKSSLSTGSWDALVARLVDSRSILPEQDSGIVQRLTQLSPGYGQGLGSRDTQYLPDYVLDGNMAMEGLMHRALRGQIAAGSFEGACEIFHRILKRADTNKVRSLIGFISGKKALLRSLTQDEMFTSNMTGIDYPAFDVQIPPTILGPFLELAIEAKDLDFARWLLYNDDVDGPIISERLHTNPHVQPAVARFAAETADRRLLSKFKDIGLTKRSFVAIFDTQVNALRWDAARRILEMLSERDDRQWTIHNLANVVRVMLMQAPGADAGARDATSNLEHVKSLFAAMVSQAYGPERRLPNAYVMHVQALLAVLSSVSGTWAELCSHYRLPWRYVDFTLDTKAFNTILEGVVAAYGSAAGRRLLGIFWPHAARNAHDAASKLTRKRQTRMSLPHYRPGPLHSVKRQRIRIIVRDERMLKRNLVVYGVCTPNFATIMLILRKALEELQAARQASISPTHVAVHDSTVNDLANLQGENVDLSPRGMVAWGVRRLAELPDVGQTIVGDVDNVLVEMGMEDLRAELPRVVEEVESDLMADIEAMSTNDASSIQDGEIDMRDVVTG